MASVVEIYNLALGHIGDTTTVVDTTEGSKQAKVCNRFYTQARDKVLRSYKWSFLRSFVTLSLVSNDPTDEWDYEYKYPANVDSFIGIVSGTVPDTNSSKLDYIIVYGTSDKVIYTNEEDAEAEVILKDTDTGRYPPEVVLAISYKLAELILPALAAGDRFKMRQEIKQLYLEEVAEAICRDGNENSPPLDAKSDIERAREA